MIRRTYPNKLEEQSASCGAKAKANSKTSQNSIRRFSGMAIYHCHIDCYRRSEGRSAVGGLAYRRGIKTVCEVTGRRFDFRKKEEVIFSDFVPAKCDIRTHDLASIKSLFQDVEKGEKKCNATLGREVECALPNELTTAEQIELTRGFISRIRAEANADGAFFDFSIHAKNGNSHVHIAMSERELESTADGYKLSKNKRRDWHEKNFVETCRKAWEIETNHALEKAGIAQRVDNRTLASQGVEKIPTLHEGKGRYFDSERKRMNEKIINKNALLTAPTTAPDDDLSKIYGASYEHCGTIENADPRPARDITYQYRLAQQQYTEAFAIRGLTYCRINNPKYVVLWFSDKTQIVDNGNSLTATEGGTAQENAKRLVLLGKLKGWTKLTLAGSDAFVFEAMMNCASLGLDVSPTDESQRKLWERIQAEAIATTAQVIAHTNSAHVVPTLTGLGEKLGKSLAPSANTPKRGRGLGL